MKRQLTAFAAAALTLGTMAPAAFAATASTPSYFANQIHVGSYNANVQALKVQDAGNTTALFPFYYIQSGLQSLGYTVKWDGVAKRLDITTPNGVNFDQSNLNPGVGAVGIYINGVLVQRAPFQVANDMGGNKKPTSFMAAYYLDQALARVGFTNTYDGTGAGWTLTAPAVYGQASGVKLAATTPIVANGASTETVTATVVDDQGRAVTGFNGAVNVAITANGAAYLTTDDASDAGSPITVNVKNGIAKFDLLASSSAGLTDTITLSALTPDTHSTVASNVSYDSTTITSVAPVATGLGLAVVSGQPSTLSANTANSTQFNVTINDQSATEFTLGGAYVTLTLTGAGSFSNSSVQTSETLWVNGDTHVSPITVYSLAGQAGTISISAAASGLAGGTLSIPTYINTAPNSVSVTSKAGTDAATGAAYTLYTVQLLDTNGHPISNAADGLSVTDNAGAQGGELIYGTINSSGVFVPGTAPTSMTNGMKTFAVETKTVGTSPATITVTDTAHSFKATAPYTFTAENATTVDVTPAAGTNYKVQAGQGVTFKAQLVDAHDNSVSVAGQKVVFAFSANSVGATFPNGSSVDTYSATTDANGVATVTVTVPSTASAGTFAVKAEDANLSSPTYVTGATVNVVTGSTYATSISLSGTPTVVQTAGSTLSAVTVSPKNAVGDPVTGDTIQVTTSNSKVVSFITPDVAGGSTQTFGAGVYSINDLKAGQAGTATITVTDISNPAKPSKTFSVSVQPSTWSQDIVQYNGSTVSSGNPLSVTADTPVALTVVHADAGTNPVPATANDWVALNDGGQGGSFRLSANGAAVSEVQIPQGQSTVTVYYVNPSTTTVSSFAAIDNQPAPANAAQSTLTASAGTAGADITYTLVLKDSSGNAVSGQASNIHVTGLGGTVSQSGAVTETATPGTYTFKVQDTKAEALSIGATYNGIALTAANVTVNPAAASTLTVTGLVAQAHGTAQAVTVTAKDQYGNVATGYTGTIHFTSSDAGAVLPADYTFVAGDNGAHIFNTITFSGAGTFTVTATDAATSSITGTSASVTVS